MMFLHLTTWLAGDMVNHNMGYNNIMPYMTIMLYVDLNTGLLLSAINSVCIQQVNVVI